VEEQRRKAREQREVDDQARADARIKEMREVEEAKEREKELASDDSPDIQAKLRTLVSSFVVFACFARPSLELVLLTAGDTNTNIRVMLNNLHRVCASSLVSAQCVVIDWVLCSSRWCGKRAAGCRSEWGS